MGGEDENTKRKCIIIKRGINFLKIEKDLGDL